MSITMPIVKLIHNIRHTIFRTSHPNTITTILVRRQLRFNTTRHVTIRRLTIKSSITQIRAMSITRVLLSFLNHRRHSTLSSRQNNTPHRHRNTRHHRHNTHRHRSTPTPSDPLPPTTRHITSNLQLQTTSHKPYHYTIPNIFNIISPSIFLNKHAKPTITLLTTIPSSNPPNIIPLLLAYYRHPSL